jgi:SAM-dependent methyltransferase
MKFMKNHFRVACLPDGRAMLHLGCSARVAEHWNNIDFSLLLRIGQHPAFCSLFFRIGLLNKPRYERIKKLAGQLIVWDLKKGIPFADKMFDVVYHSHVLEHIDREHALDFLNECHRVLKPGGTIRIVVPDFELLAKQYLDVVRHMPDTADIDVHEAAVAKIIDQMVLRVPRERAKAGALVRLLENILLGDTAKSGNLHRWMYDRLSLAAALEDSCFHNPQVLDEKRSAIIGWNDFQLDTEPDGSPYKHNSLYMEATK